ncbi:MAG: SAM-dependent chlorinase/fluorinase [Bacteroidota bacterium]|nr:SAM-dependent chlorinase/fluorinase [Bacteroidota bacterium]
MTVITLTTDWVLNDYYVGVVKGAILSGNAGVSIVDITHQIYPFNTAQAAFVLKNSFSYFPEGSIHIMAVNKMAAREQPEYVVVKQQGHYFIGANDGTLGLMFDEDDGVVVSIEQFVKAESHIFAALHIFVPVALHLAGGGAMEDLGTVLPSFKRMTPLLAITEESVIAGVVIFVDSYQNAITNIRRDEFEQVQKGRRFEIVVQSNHYKINTISKSYNEVSDGELLAVFNSAGLLEIAINRGSAAELLNLGINSRVRVKFY